MSLVFIVVFGLAVYLDLSLLPIPFTSRSKAR
ncbi:hypothetical protein ES703_27003 [subsurface metagenome]